MNQKINLISAYWLEQNKLKHQKELNWGIGGIGFLIPILNFAHKLMAKTILDYGCGKGLLGQLLQNNGFAISNYDPAIFGEDNIPFPCDLVVCTDVLEHIEIQYLNNVIDHIKSLANKGIFFTISTKQAIHNMPDGSNAHKIIAGEEFWIKQIREGFDIKIYTQSNDTLIIEAIK